jgi:hypothetical protein
VIPAYDWYTLTESCLRHPREQAIDHNPAESNDRQPCREAAAHLTDSKASPWTTTSATSSPPDQLKRLHFTGLRTATV